MILTYNVIANLLFLAFGCAGVTVLLYECMQEGMVFGVLGERIKGYWWAKPLGICTTCTNVWVSIGGYLVFMGAKDLNSVLYMMVFVGISNAILRKL